MRRRGPFLRFQIPPKFSSHLGQTACFALRAEAVLTIQQWQAIGTYSHAKGDFLWVDVESRYHPDSHRPTVPQLQWSTLALHGVTEIFDPTASICLRNLRIHAGLRGIVFAKLVHCALCVYMTLYSFVTAYNVKYLGEASVN